MHRPAAEVKIPVMDIEIQSQDLIDALSELLTKTVVELETTKLALQQTQDIAANATRALREAMADFNPGSLTNKAIELSETKEDPSSE